MSFIRENRLFLLGLGPGLIIALAIEILLWFGVVFPMPYLLIYASVVFAGVYGGTASALVMAAIGTALVARIDLLGDALSVLPGNSGPLALVALIYFGTAAGLGWLLNRRNAILEREKMQRESLQQDLQRADEDQQRTRFDLQKHEARLQTAVRIAGIGHFAFDSASANCIFCSEQHAAHFGLTPDEFKTLTSGPEPELFYIHPDDRERVVTAIRRIKFGETMSFEYRGLHTNGDTRHIHEIVEPVFDQHGTVIEEVGTSMDMTDLRRTEQKLLASQKLEAVGHLTAGVAHDFNNLLAVILGNLELLEMGGQDAEARELIENAIAATQRGASLTAQLLSFGRKAMLAPKNVNVCKTLDALGTLLRRTIPTTIDIRIDQGEMPCNTYLDESQFEAAFLNLALNAADAMPDGGTIAISVTAVDLDTDEIARLDLSVTPGTYVTTTVTDTGTGMSDQVLAQAFDPFFTTKEVGKGSGMGLSMVLGFARQTGGDVRIVSTPGKGTAITLYFRYVDPATRPEPPPRLDTGYTAGGELILVVEDDPAVRRIVRSQLDSLGYRVLTASDGAEAQKVLNMQQDIAIVISDIIMPGGVSGVDLARELRQTRPELPVILMTGYQGDSNPASLDDVDVAALLIKPVPRRVLNQAIRNALNSARQTENASHQSQNRA